MGEALLKTQPSIKKPVPSDDNWLVIGVDPQFKWDLEGPGGHYYLFKPTYKYEKDAQQRASNELDALAIHLAKLSREAKSEIIEKAIAAFAPGAF